MIIKLDGFYKTEVKKKKKKKRKREGERERERNELLFLCMVETKIKTTKNVTTFWIE